MRHFGTTTRYALWAYTDHSFFDRSHKLKGLFLYYTERIMQPSTRTMSFPKDAFYPASMALKAAKAYGKGVVEITPKPKEKQYNKGIYLNVKWNIVAPNHGADGFFTLRDVPILHGAANISDPNDRRVKDKTERYLSFSTNALGDFGEFLKIASPVCTAQLEGLKATGKIATGFIKPLLRTHISDTCADASLRGKPLDVPIFDVGFDWDVYPATHFKKHLAGKPKMNVFDADKPVLDDNGTQMKDDRGNLLYHPATVEVDGVEQAVCAMNQHLFITDNSTAVIMDIRLDSCFVNKNQASIPDRFTTLVIRTGKESAVVRIDDNVELDILNVDKPTKIVNPNDPELKLD